VLGLGHGHEGRYDTRSLLVGGKRIEDRSAQGRDYGWIEAGQHIERRFQNRRRSGCRITAEKVPNGRRAQVEDPISDRDAGAKRSLALTPEYSERQILHGKLAARTVG